MYHVSAQGVDERMINVHYYYYYYYYYVIIMSLLCNYYVDCQPLRVIIGRSCHKYHFCRDKSLLLQTRLLSGQKYACRYKTFFATNTLSRQKYFVATNIILSRQKYACRDKTFFTTTYCRDKNILSRQSLFCLDKSFVAASIVRDNSFVSTKMTVVVALANDSGLAVRLT